MYKEVFEDIRGDKSTKYWFMAFFLVILALGLFNLSKPSDDESPHNDEGKAVEQGK